MERLSAHHFKISKVRLQKAIKVHKNSYKNVKAALLQKIVYNPLEFRHKNPLKYFFKLQSPPKKNSLS